MARYTQDDEIGYLDDEQKSRRNAMLDQMEGPAATATPGPSASPELSPPSSSGSLPPSAPPPSPTGSGNPFDPNTPPYFTPGTPAAVAQPSYSQQETTAPTWDPNTNAPPGMKWDPNVASYVPSNINFDPTGYHMGPNGQLVGNTPTTPGATQAPSAGRTDQNYIRSVVQRWMQANNPQGHQDPEYWVRRILETGGLGPDNQDYWLGRFTEAPGTHQEGAPQQGQGGTQQGPGFTYTQGGGLTPEISNYFKTLTDQINAQVAQNQQLVDARRQALLNLLAKGQEPVDVQNDPTLRGASDAYRLSRNRGAQREREALAERAAFTGLNSGGQGSGTFDVGVQGINEGASQDVAGYDANLALNEMNQRRNTLLQAIQIADAIGARNEAQQLNSTLAQLDAAMKQQQLALSYAGLNQNQGQFEDNIALQYAQLLQNANRNSLLFGLGG